MGRIIEIAKRMLRITPKFEGSSAYWNRRYANGGNSGAGSYGALAEFKASTLNQFVAIESAESIIEFGCGDGNQLTLAEYPSYLGVDVSELAVANCRDKFSKDNTKNFVTKQQYRGEKADIAMSLDVIYHLVENDVFHEYMTTLFDSAVKWVIVYSSNFDGDDEAMAEHVRHRKFTDWVDENRPGWSLSNIVKNKFPFTGDYRTGSHADFYFYENPDNR